MSNAVAVEEDGINVEAAKASRERLAEAERVLKIRTEMDRKAGENVQRIETSWRFGSDEFSGADLAAARVEVERAKSLLVAADLELSRARRGLLTDSPDIAAAVAEHAAKALHVELVRYSNAAPSFDLDHVPDDLPLPCLYVVQKRPTDRGRGGLTGEVELVLIRHVNHRELDTTELANALIRDGWTVSFDRPASYASDKRGKCVATLHVGVGFEAVPVLAHAPYGAGQAAGVAIGNLAKKHSKGTDISYAGDGQPKRHEYATLGFHAEAVSNKHEIAEDGTRITTSIVDVLGWPEHGRTLSEVGHFLKNAVPQVVGRAVPYGGRITEATVISAGPDALAVEGQILGRKVFGIRVKVVSTSKVPASA